MLDEPHTHDEQALPRCRRGSKRRNYWRTRRPQDYVTYPELVPLTYLQEVRLIERAQTGDVSARNQVWLHYARLTLAVINEFRVPEPMLADAIQEGCTALVRAIERFEIERYIAFSTYAWYWIYQAIQRFLSKHQTLVRIPNHLWRDLGRYHADQFRRQTTAEVDRPSPWADDPPLEEQLRHCYRLTCLVPWHDVPTQQHRSYRDTTAETPDWEAICRTALHTLRERERMILTRRYGLFGTATATLKEIADDLGLSRERVRQVQAKAERKLARRCPDLQRLIAHGNDAAPTKETPHDGI